jgi:chemotaxis protein MotB
VSRRGKGADHGEEADERWVISYADLVTLLFGFFILLFASADQNRDKFFQLATGLSEAFNVPINEGNTDESPLFDGGTGVLPDRSQRDITLDEDLAFLRARVREQSIEAGVLGKILVTSDGDRIVIRLADNLLFPSASADIRTEALPLLDIVAAAVSDIGNELRIEGHTDSIPIVTERYATNWELSSARATAVLRRLEEAGVEPARMHAAGWAEFQPVADNSTPEGRALNRRADIVVLYPAASVDAGGDR